ncbi:MAG: AMP-binding protein [Desulfovermiculus sp.]|nr:AMP-binding protein [Desulfovermiculus sp.]
MTDLLEGVVPYPPEDAQRYNHFRWWYGLPLGDVLDRAADILPGKEGFVDRTSRLTYAQARDTADRLALGLLEAGIQPLDRILIQLPNWNEFVYVYFALQKLGAIPVLLIDRYRQFEIEHLGRLSGATAWIGPVEYKKTDYKPIIQDVLAEVPELQTVITVRGYVEGWLSLDKLMARESSPTDGERLAALRPDPMQVAHMGPTGGTTGAPKIVPRTHNSLITGFDFCSKAWQLHSEDVTLLPGPIGHDLTYSKGFIGSVLSMAKVVFSDSTENQYLFQTIERERVTAIVLVPTLAQRMLQFEDLESYDVRSLRKMHSAGGASHPDLVREVSRKLNMKFYNGYGSTEGITTITRPYDDVETACRSVGQPTCPYDTYKVIDSRGNELPPNQQGELVLKGPGVFTGYYRSPEENHKAFTADGYFKTGDLARIDEQGYITLTGRLKEMINRGGESISATEIERLISEHPRVAAVAVIPMPDRDLGERACAYIEPAQEARLSFDEIISFLKSKKASVLQLPERIEFIKAMPYTQAQKLNKKALIQDIERKLGY